MDTSIVTTGLLATAVVFPILATASVGVRLWGRQLIRGLPLTSSDYTMFLTLFFCWTFSITTFVAAHQIGVDKLKVSPIEGIIISQRMLWAGSYSLIGALCAVKISILQFYAQMFVTKKFVLAVNVTNFILVGWFFANVFCFIFSQNPILGLWTDGPIKLRYDYGAFIVASSTISLLLDIVVLLFPYPYIRTLKLDRRQKTSIIAMFSLGAFCCIASVARFVYLYRDVYKSPISAGATSNPHIFATQYTLWQHIEPNASVIAACLPTYGAFFMRSRSPSSTESLNKSIISKFSRQNSKSSSRSETSYHLSDVDKDRRIDNPDIESQIPVGYKEQQLRIGVTKTVEVSRHSFK